jgi:hypothetical protein
VTILEGHSSSRSTACVATLEGGTPVEGTSESRTIGASRLPSQGGIVLF